MTDLQLALLALGVVIIIAIVLFNWWQEHKLRSDISQRFEEPKRDALMDEFQLDPEAIFKDKPAAHQGSEFDEDKVEQAAEPVIKPVFEPTIPMEPLPHEEIVNTPINEVNLAVQEFERDMASPYQEAEPEAYTGNAYNEENEAVREMATTDELVAEAGLDAVIAPEPSFEPTQPGAAMENSEKLPVSVNQQIDLIALLYLPQPATGMALREFFQLLTGLDKPTFANGLDSDGIWHALTEDQEDISFTRAAYSLQLADRAGFISKALLNRCKASKFAVSMACKLPK